MSTSIQVIFRQKIINLWAISRRDYAAKYFYELKYVHMKVHTRIKFIVILSKIIIIILSGIIIIL